MSAFQQLKARIDGLPPTALSLLRIALGIMLIIKGIEFISHIQQLEDIIARSRFQGGQSFLTYYIPYAHLLGGFFILIGLYTRFFSIIQIPVLIGAVFFVNAPSSAFHVQTGEFGFSIIVLLLLIFFSIAGSVQLSIGDWLRHHKGRSVGAQIDAPRH
jgi:putative oxidoreductase